MQVPTSEWTNIWVDSLVLLREGVLSIPIQLINLAQHDCAYCLSMKTSVLNKVCFQNVIL